MYLHNIDRATSARDLLQISSQQHADMLSPAGLLHTALGGSLSASVTRSKCYTRHRSCTISCFVPVLMFTQSPCIVTPHVTDNQPLSPNSGTGQDDKTHHEPLTDPYQEGRSGGEFAPLDTMCLHHPPLPHAQIRLIKFYSFKDLQFPSRRKIIL